MKKGENSLLHVAESPDQPVNHKVSLDDDLNCLNGLLKQIKVGVFGLHMLCQLSN